MSSTVYRGKGRRKRASGFNSVFWYVAAITGSLYAAGYSPSEISAIISEIPPYDLFTPSPNPCQGLISLERVVERLRTLLPSSFEDLDIPFAAAVVKSDKLYQLVTEIFAVGLGVRKGQG